MSEMSEDEKVECLVCGETSVLIVCPDCFEQKKDAIYLKYGVRQLKDTISQLVAALREQRRGLSHLEELMDSLGIPSDPAHPLRFRLGRLALDHVSFVEALTAARVLAGGGSGADISPSSIHAEPRFEESVRAIRNSFVHGAPIQRPMRETVLSSLNELSVPSSPMTIAQYVRGLYKVVLNPSRFASLRRDEKNGYLRDPRARSSWVAPALSTEDFTPVPRLVTDSSWDLEKRLVGKLTPRVNNLKTVIVLAEKSLSLNEDSERAARLKPLLLRFCSLEYAAIEERYSAADIKAAAEAELKLVEEKDLEERKASAALLKDSGSEATQLWGNAWGTGRGGKDPNRRGLSVNQREISEQDDLGGGL